MFCCEKPQKDWKGKAIVKKPKMYLQGWLNLHLCSWNNIFWILFLKQLSQGTLKPKTKNSWRNFFLSFWPFIFNFNFLLKASIYIDIIPWSQSRSTAVPFPPWLNPFFPTSLSCTAISSLCLLVGRSCVGSAVNSGLSNVWKTVL